MHGINENVPKATLHSKAHKSRHSVLKIIKQPLGITQQPPSLN